MTVNNEIKSDFQYIRNELQPQFEHQADKAWTNYVATLPKKTINGIDVPDFSANAGNVDVYMDKLTANLKKSIAVTGHMGILNPKFKGVVMNTILKNMFGLDSDAVAGAVRSRGMLTPGMKRNFNDQYMETSQKYWQDASIDTEITPGKLPMYKTELVADGFTDATRIKTAAQAKQFAQLVQQTGKGRLEDFLKSIP